MKTRVKKIIVGALLGGKGQVLLLLFLLSALIAGRFIWFQPHGIPLNQLGYAVETSGDYGAVLFSRNGNEQQLILNGDDLLWRGGETTEQIAQHVVNLHSSQDRVWVKTRTEITEVDMLTGTAVKLLSVEDSSDSGLSFEDARLVGVEDEQFYLVNGDLLQVMDWDGRFKEPYYFDGRRSPTGVEPNWRQGVLFFQSNTWTLYLDFSPEKPVRLDHRRGELQEVILSPDGSSVVYALQRDQSTEIWYSRINGSDAKNLYVKDKIFSSFKAVWSPDSSLLVMTVLGYEKDAGYDDNFISATLLHQPGRQGTMALSKSYGPEVRALTPTAWDLDEYNIWFYWLHQEQISPVSYSLYRK